MGNGNGRGNAILRFFFEAFFDGIKKRTKSFLSIAGFICALGFVYAANEGYHSVFGHKPANEVTEVSEPDSNSVEGAARNLASVPSTQIKESKSKSENRGGAGSSANGESNVEPDPGTSAGEIANSGSGVSGAQQYYNRGGGSYSPGVVQGNAPAHTADAPKANSDSGLSDGYSQGAYAKTPDATVAVNPSVANGSGGGTVVVTPASPATAFQLSSGGGFGQGSFLQVEASAGEVTSPNYHSNSSFTLISGVAGMVSGD